MGTDFSHFEDVFNRHIKGRMFSNSSSHDGSLGHWLEVQCGVRPNAIPGADLDGYEIKSGGQKGSFGDWMAGWYLWYDSPFVQTKEQFLNIFGSKKREDKPNRVSWTGSDYGSKVSNVFTRSGQRLSVNEFEEIIVEYSYEDDHRPMKSQIIPPSFQVGVHVIVRWERERISEFVENKFGQRGWVMFSVRTVNGVKTVDSLYLGQPFNFSFWIYEFGQGNIILDSGMNSDNNRNYSTFRAPKSWWIENSFRQIS